jgi:dynein heavy chain
MNVILELGNPNMKGRHWEKVYAALQQPWYEGLSFCLEDLLSYNILNHADLVSETSAAASGEAQLEDSLETIQTGWADMEFVCLNHRDQNNIYILGGLDDIFMLLEDNQVTLQTMMGSRFIMGVREEVETWSKKLGLLSETIDEWVACQRNWMYLETIFCAEDIQKQLPVESQKFMVVDKMWKTIMKQTNENPRVIASIDDGSSLLEKFQQANETLESVQKSLEDYLETKRMAFPRFYFLSNDELLEILSQTRDPHAVQPHMQKCFDSIKSIAFGEGKQAKQIIGFNDPDGEKVKMTEDCQAEGPVEHWLTATQYCMRKALYDNAATAWDQYAKDEAGQIDREQWLFGYPAQIILMIDQVYWTGGLGSAILAIEEGRDAEAVEKFFTFSLAQIEAMVKLVQHDLTKQQRTMMGALITIDVNKRDVTKATVEQKVSRTDDFQWTKQLRYYWEDKSDHKSTPTFETGFDCVARQTNTCFPYGYEYLGNGPRLVITPLTDICYMTLTGGMHMKLGGAPAGPAGTGKTETTKDLAKALAVYCVVFNCSDGLDFKIMGRFFSGLAQQGAWACFDEFNRIDIEVLSVIAQQVLCIQQAMVMNLKEFEFEANLIPLKPSFGVFITMNPGYAGRAELPDNLKALFRPVAMMVPDYRLIAEIVLFSEGFSNAFPLSNKMQQLYALASEQLSKQDHYDFGMRAVKSVLVAAGQLKRKEPETHEDLLLIRAMRDSNVPKFLEHDLPLFGGILSDLFPGLDVPFVDYGLLQTAIEDALEAQGLQKVPSFISKVIQVHETQLVRHGMMVVGETGSGKSTNMKILAEALTKLHSDGVVDRDDFYKTVDRLILNPKSITAGELYGEFNQMTNEWKDGIVPKLVRSVCQAQTDGSDNRKWIIFDGPVDAIWIENMNTVLDDNKTLCLANSERIKLPKTLHMMFEVQDLKVASPATVSRCGMVYMEQVHVGILSLVKTWGQNSLAPMLGNDELAATVVAAVSDHVVDGIAFVREFCTEKVRSDDACLTQSLLNMLYSILDPARGFHPDHPKAGTNVKLFFVWAFVWSIGANIDDSSRAKFQEWALKRFISFLPDECVTFLQDVYGHVMDEEKSAFVPWADLMSDFKFDVATPYFNIIVPTIETTRYNFILKKLMCGGYNVLLSAETGVGKSIVIQQFLDQQSATNEYTSYTMGYSAQTKPSNIRDVMEEKLEKKRKTLLGPPAGKKMLFFVDDVNMPALETYGAQPPNELLRQIIDQKGFYDTNKLFFKNVADVIFAAACAPPGGGRNELSPRLQRQFSMIWLTSLSGASMTKIFGGILEGFLSKTIPNLATMATPIVAASVQIYEKVGKDLLPTPARSHYTFNLRDLGKVFQGMLQIEPKHAPDEASLLRLWCHEECRVVRDRLIDEGDRDWFNATLKEMLAVHMSTEWETADFSDLLFGDYLTRDDKQYQIVKDNKQVHDLLVEYLEEYNITFPSQMHLVFFQDAINHISRICRVLRQPRGNALLVGVGGSGRQSLSR